MTVQVVLSSCGGSPFAQLAVDHRGGVDLEYRNEADILFLPDPFAEADEDTGETKQSQNYIHIRIQRMFTPWTSLSPTTPAPPATPTNYLGCLQSEMVERL